MSDNGVVWEDPPEPRFGGHPAWRERLAPLIERPGEWARVLKTPNAQTARSQASRLSLKKRGSLPGQWEFVTRTKDGMAFVYARYLGPDDG